MGGRIAAALLMLTACNGGEPEDTDTVPVGGVSDECGTSNPEIAELTISDGGFVPEGDQCPEDPTVLISVAGHDPDGDLHNWGMRVMFDDVVDGQVQATTTNVLELPINAVGGDPEPCEVTDANLGMRVCIGGNPPHATELEWSVVLIDDRENESEPMIEVFTTPNPDGTYPE